ncbi:DUF4113 domain-containing protein [Pseudomonas peli]|uniref:DUF4113 domain-containing protein n=1 Tax=Pseudomonas peli TaxID=592361 RepID=UPI00286D4818|nr:DUF4113 domain-containing protein [Pseudomonas peli]
MTALVQPLHWNPLKVMGMLNEINAKWCSRTLRHAGVPLAPAWGIKREMLSPSYTTMWDQLWAVKAG